MLSPTQHLHKTFCEQSHAGPNWDAQAADGLKASSIENPFVLIIVKAGGNIQLFVWML